MNGIRNWMIQKCQENLARYEGVGTFEFQKLGSNGVRVVRQRRPDGFVYCIAPGANEALDGTTIDRIRAEMPAVQFIAVAPNRITNEAYEHASSIGLCVEGFGELPQALMQDDDIAKHRSREHAYVMRRISQSKGVEGVVRRGRNAYDIRRYGLSSITLVTIDHYEITSDDVYSLVEMHPELSIDYIAITNPSAQGVATDAVTAGRNAGVKVLLFKHFLDVIMQP